MAKISVKGKKHVAYKPHTTRQKKSVELETTLKASEEKSSLKKRRRLVKTRTIDEEEVPHVKVVGREDEETEVEESPTVRKISKKSKVEKGKATE